MGPRRPRSHGSLGGPLQFLSSSYCPFLSAPAPCDIRGSPRGSQAERPRPGWCPPPGCSQKALRGVREDRSCPAGPLCAGLELPTCSLTRYRVCEVRELPLTVQLLSDPRSQLARAAGLNARPLTTVAHGSCSALALGCSQTRPLHGASRAHSRVGLRCLPRKACLASAVVLCGLEAIDRPGLRMDLGQRGWGDYVFPTAESPPCSQAHRHYEEAERALLRGCGGRLLWVGSALGTGLGVL